MRYTAIKCFIPLLVLSLLTGCADVRSRDCWFEHSQPIDYTAALKPAPDPLLDLWTLPYSPCELQQNKTSHIGH